MTQQFKFGDRVQDSEGKQFIFLRSFLSSCTVASSDGKTHNYLLDKIYPCATEPHPDTVRLDWLLENAGINVGEEDYYRRKYIYDRDAIDAAMNKEKNND